MIAESSSGKWQNHRPTQITNCNACCLICVHLWLRKKKTFSNRNGQQKDTTLGVLVEMANLIMLFWSTVSV